jgi:hypothetical protein
MWSYKHLSRPYKHTYTFLGHMAPHSPLSIALIMHTPLSSIRSRTHLSLGRHIHLSLLYRAMHTTPLSVVLSHVHLSRLNRPTNTFLGHPSPHTHLTFFWSNEHLPPLIFIPMPHLLEWLAFTFCT